MSGVQVDWRHPNSWERTWLVKLGIHPLAKFFLILPLNSYWFRYGWTLRYCWQGCSQPLGKYTVFIWKRNTVGHWHVMLDFHWLSRWLRCHCWLLHHEAQGSSTRHSPNQGQLCWRGGFHSRILEVCWGKELDLIYSIYTNTIK